MIYFYVNGVRQDYTYTANLSIDFSTGITIGNSDYSSESVCLIYDWFLDDGVAIIQESTFQKPQHPFSHNYNKSDIKLKDENGKLIENNHVLRDSADDNQYYKHWFISSLPLNQDSFYFEASIGDSIGNSVIGSIGFAFSLNDKKVEFLTESIENYYSIYPSFLLYLSQGYGTEVISYNSKNQYTSIKRLVINSYLNGNIIGFAFKLIDSKIHFYLYNNGELICNFIFTDNDNSISFKNLCPVVAGNTYWNFPYSSHNQVKMDATLYFNQECKYLDIAKQFNNTNCLFKTDQMVYKVNDNSTFERVENISTWNSESVENKKTLIKDNSYPHDYVPIHQMICLNSTVSKLIKLKEE